MADNPVILLVKTPNPLPSVVKGSAVVGLPVVFQQTPLTVTGDVPSLKTLPPLVAVVCVIAEGAVVVTIAGPGYRNHSEICSCHTNFRK